MRKLGSGSGRFTIFRIFYGRPYRREAMPACGLVDKFWPVSSGTKFPQESWVFSWEAAGIGLEPSAMAKAKLKSKAAPETV
jgi:hypothetical protein